MSRVLLRLIGAINLFVFGLWTLFTLLAVVPLQLLALPWDPHRRMSARVGRLVWGVGMIGAQPFWRRTITGLERLEGQGPFIIVANHQSMLDIPLLLNLPIPIKVAARPGVFKMPVFGQMARFARHPCVDPEAPEASIDACKEALANGFSVVLFPEGQRGDGVTLGKFQRGAFELALRTGAPLLPVAISGTSIALPKGSAWARANISRLCLQVLEPIPVEGRSRRKLAADALAVIEPAVNGPKPWEISHRVMERFRPAGRGRAGFAAGKTLFDPIFWALWQRLPRVGRVLDVGAGEGLLGHYLRAAGSGVTVHGLDIDAARVEAARVAAKDDPALTFEVADGQDAPFPVADAVVCIDVLHYLPPAAQDAMIARLCAAVAPGGVLYIRDPEVGEGFASWWTATSERIFVAMGRHAGGGVHVRGGQALAGAVGVHLGAVRTTRLGTGPFANVLVEGRRSTAR